MSDARAEALRSIIEQSYQPFDHPALHRQARDWEAIRPLDGVRILDATPAFPNTLAKYLALLVGGADLTVSLPPQFPHHPDMVDLLTDIGIPVVHGPEVVGDFDVVVDCAGLHASTMSRTGYVELTKSGERVYQDSPKPVILVDDSRIKHIETSLGTGDGFVRGLAHFGHGDLSGKQVVIFGCGKVGRGMAARARDAGALVTVIDLDPGVTPPAGCALVTGADADAVAGAIEAAWCVASATGQPAGMASLVDVLRESDLVLANLGAEDEFGPEMPADRVLNGKAPLNFALAEPTRLRYIDATMALDNACALALLEGGFAPGINRVPVGLEDEILAVTRINGSISRELAAIEGELS